MEISRIFRSLVDVSRNLIFIEFSGILKSIESSGFLRHGVDISRNLRLVNFSKFSRF